MFVVGNCNKYTCILIFIREKDVHFNLSKSDSLRKLNIYGTNHQHL